MEPVNTQIKPNVNLPKIGITPGVLKQTAANLFAKFYVKKKIFLLVPIPLGLIFLVLIIGLVFGNRRGAPTVKPTKPPAAFIEPTSRPNLAPGVLLDSQNSLDQLKLEIEKLDIKQSRLTPPTFYFEIKF